MLPIKDDLNFPNKEELIDGGEKEYQKIAQIIEEKIKDQLSKGDDSDSVFFTYNYDCNNETYVYNSYRKYAHRLPYQFEHVTPNGDVSYIRVYIPKELILKHFDPNHHLYAIKEAISRRLDPLKAFHYSKFYQHEEVLDVVTSYLENKGYRIEFDQKSLTITIHI